MRKLMIALVVFAAWSSIAAADFEISVGFDVRPVTMSSYEAARREAMKAGKGLMVWIDMDFNDFFPTDPSSINVNVKGPWHGVEGPAVVIAEPCHGEAGLRWRETRLFRAGRFRTSYRSVGYSSAPSPAGAWSPAPSRSGYRANPGRRAGGGC